MSRYNPSVIDRNGRNTGPKTIPFALPASRRFGKDVYLEHVSVSKCQRLHVGHPEGSPRPISSRATMHESEVGPPSDGVGCIRPAGRTTCQKDGDSSSYYYRRISRTSNASSKCSVFRSIGIVNRQRPDASYFAGAEIFSRSLRYVVESGIRKRGDRFPNFRSPAMSLQPVRKRFAGTLMTIASPTRSKPR